MHTMQKKNNQAHMLSFSFLFLVIINSTACKNTCEDACSKLIETCSAKIPSYSVKQCTDDCSAVQLNYESYDYLEPQLIAFQEQLDCIVDSSCEDLLDTNNPPCYDDELFAF